MKKYSITKYSMDIDYQKEPDWTSIYDIGKVFNSIKFNYETYKNIEDSYVNAILLIANHMNIETFKVNKIFRWKDLNNDMIANQGYYELYNDEMLMLYNRLQDNDFINKTDLCNLIRLELREDIGAQIFTPYKLKIFIGYDFMMGVHSSMSLESIVSDINELGLYVYPIN